ncbi:MAG: family 1 glycosylhydrolase [Pseudomonadota bacterium]|nr:family 1 glycosylhydrolase [Pseudomonadota bacterium]
MKPLELWGGVECTVNRVHDRWHDQLRLGGHHERIDDLDRIADLGIRTVRYPVLWERVAPDHPDRFDWSWSDARLARLEALGITPIVGLLHHGSGPRYTNLVDPAFPELFARFAAAAARRYPWVRDWTPVNEPLTTARFSALYGFWFPHVADETAFLRALVQQLLGVAAAMRAIREVVPDARLVQTEDLGRTFSTPRLAYQADYENARRLLSLDLLTGTFGPGSALWKRVRGMGFSEAELRATRCPPDIIGVNYYVTSDRVLDERLSHYPGHTAGGNGRDAYVDVEAVRTWGPGLLGHARLLGEIWARYGRPVAITEAFLGCTREEQLRWLQAAWQGAEAARAEGVDVRAVTAWSLFGAHDWDSLVTQVRGGYEPGAFDVRGGLPRETALGGLVRDLATGTPPQHPALGTDGWWTQPTRLSYPAVGPVSPPPRARGKRLPLLLLGAESLLGQALVEVCALRGLPYRLAAAEGIARIDRDGLLGWLDAHRPWALVDAAGLHLGPASACAARSLPLLAFAREVRGTAAALHPEALIVRGFAAEQAPRGLRGLVHAALDLLVDGEQGAWHFADPDGPRRWPAAGRLRWGARAGRRADGGGER